MVQNSLVKYIREQIRAGYDINSIRIYLLKYGYPESTVNEALQFAYPPTAVKHVFHPSKTTIVLIVAIVCSLILVSAALFTFLKPKSQLLDIETDLLTEVIETGNDLKFTAQLFNLGKARNYDVSLKYEIYTLQNELMKFKEETIAIETRASSSVSMNLAGLPPGNYYLRTTALYGNKIARATSSFRITKEETTIKTPQQTPQEVPTQIVSTMRCPFSCDDNNKCTRDYCSEDTRYQCRNEIIYSCCGNGICESNEDYGNCLADCKVAVDKGEDIFGDKPVWERIDMIADIAKGDKEKALLYCSEIEQSGYRYDCITKVSAASRDHNLCVNIEDESNRDTCYKEAAIEIKDSEVCTNIVKDSKRDQCYMDFVTKGDYTVCDKLFNKYLKQSCDSLKKLSEAKVPSQ